MFDLRNDPVDLLASLHQFLRFWHVSAGWYGIEQEKLAQTILPEPLKHLYSFAGNWPEKNAWGAAFCNQDALCPFELLRMHNERLIFAWENQAVWTVGTLSEGLDPPVWVRQDREPWVQLCDSLAQFIVTLCLHETVMGCKWTGAGKEVLSLMRSRGKHVAPVWLNGPYPGIENPGVPRQLSFHLVDSKLMVFNDQRCGTNTEEFALEFPDIFKPRRELPPEYRSEVPIWENATVPLRIRKMHLESLARRNEERATWHKERAENYRRIAESLKGAPLDQA